MGDFVLEGEPKSVQITASNKALGLIFWNEKSRAAISSGKPRPPDNYGVSTETYAAVLKYSGQTVRLKTGSRSLSAGVSVTKVSSREVISGQPVCYVFSGIGNTACPPEDAESIRFRLSQQRQDQLTGKPKGKHAQRDARKRRAAGRYVRLR